MQDRKSTHARIVFGAAVWALALIGLSSTEARAQPRMPTHVACVGDSITAGYAASSASKSYPSDLQTIFGSGVRVMNFGHSGATMLSIGDLPYVNQSEYTAATTFVSNAGASAVVDVILMLGTNDSKSYNWAPQAGSTRAQQFMTDCAAMVDHFTNLSTRPVVYLAIPPAIYTNTFGISEAVTYNEIAPIIRQVALQKGMPIIDVHTPTAGHPEYFSDGVHPTDAGYMIVAQLMHDGLLQAGGGTGGAGAGGGAGGTGGAAGRGGSGGGAAGRGGAAGGGTGGAAGRGGAAGGGTGGAAGRGGAAGGGTGGAAGRGGAGGSGTGGAAGAGTGGTSAGTGGTSAGTGGTSTGTGGATAGTGAAAGTSGASGGSTGGSTAGGAGSDGGGCGCSLDADPRSGLTATLALLLVIPLLRRRRRVR